MPSDITFHKLNRFLKSFNQFKDLLFKWGFSQSLSCEIFTYDGDFLIHDPNLFLTQFLSAGTLPQLHNCVPSENATLKFREINATQLSMNFFDRLENDEIVRKETGHIIDCLDEQHQEMLLSSELQKMLVMEESENYVLYNELERNEFLFLIFKHLCLGGSLCQRDEYLEPYLDVTKSFYKELVSVKKELDSLSIISHIFEVTLKNENNTAVFPAKQEHCQDFAYVSIDPLKKNIFVFSNIF